MKTRFLALAALAALLFVSPARAHDGVVHAGDLDLAHFWVRASIGKLTNSAAYVMIKNKGGAADRLVSASSPLANKVELHEHIMEGDIAKMRPVAGVDVPAGGMAELKPGGYHIMIMGLKEPLKEGTTFPLTLTFAKGGSVKLEVPVVKGQPMKMDHGSMDHGKIDHGTMDHGSMGDMHKK